MKNKKYLYLFILTALLFFGSSKVRAEAAKCDPWFTGPGGYYNCEKRGTHYLYGSVCKDNKNSCEVAYCIEPYIISIEGAGVREVGDIIGYLRDTYNPKSGGGTNGGDAITTDASAKAFLNRMATIKYYIEKVSKSGSSQKTKDTYTQYALWRLICSTFGIDYTYKGYETDLGMNDVSDVYNSAIKFYNEHPNYIEGSGTVFVYSDWNRAQTQSVMKLKYKVVGIDYSLDMACENCESKNADSKAIVVQDTTNWDAIMKSKEMASTCKNDNLSSYYYKKDYDTYCREEYHVYYPNANNKIKVQVGRFFTVNASKDELDLVDSSIPNFAPIRVKKVRQCKNGNLEGFKAASDAEFKNCGGSVKIKYTEKQYQYEDYAKRKLTSFSSEIKDGSLIQRAEFDYTLKGNTFRYIRIADGYSLKDKPADYENNKVYKDLKVSNLPISFDKTTEPKVSFVFSLPSSDTGASCKDVYSTIRKAYSEGNDYLKCGSDIDNVYKKETEHEKLKDTACAKLYNTVDRSNEKFDKCVKDRLSNKMGNCFNSNKNKDYLCNLPVDGEIKCDESTQGKKIDDAHDYRDYAWNGKECVLKCTKYKNKYYNNVGKEIDKETFDKVCGCNETNYKDHGRDWDKNHKVCCAEGTSYIEEEGRCCNPEDVDPVTHVCAGKPKVCTESNYKEFSGVVWVNNKCCDEENYNAKTNTCEETCTVDNYASLNRDWNENEGKCCPIGQKYYEDTKKCSVDKCDMTVTTCEGSGTACCVDADGRVTDGYCINGKKVCPGKPGVFLGDAVYRTINPSDPFISQSGERRTEVGSNWCSYEVAGKSAYTCSPNPEQNPVVKSAITESNTSEDNALYTINLDTSAINKIREYNSTREYDDFDMACNSEGNACTSNFLRKTIGEYVDNSKSKCVSANNFYTCADNG